MDKTSFSDKCAILTEVHEEFRDAENWRAFFIEWDLGFILAMSSHYDLATLHEGGKKYVNQSWDAWCEALLLDSHAAYENFDEMLAFADDEESGSATSKSVSTQSSSSRFCAQCNLERNPQAQFCAQCGAKYVSTDSHMT